MKHTAMIAVMAVLGTVPVIVQAAPTERIGSAVQVVNEVSAEFDRDRRDLALGDEIHQDELIAVGPDSIGELEFTDQTKLALGPGSQLLLDKFVYKGERSKGDIFVTITVTAFGTSNVSPSAVTVISVRLYPKSAPVVASI